MSRRSLVAAVVAAFILGLGVALFTTDDHRVVSAQVWLATTLLFAGAVVASHAGSIRPWASKPMQTIVTWHRPEPDPTPIRPRDLIGYDRAVAVALTDARGFRTHLQPRLQALVEHHLGPSTNRTESALGPVAWLVDPERHPERAPTLAELDTFADRIERHRGGD